MPNQIAPAAAVTLPYCGPAPLPEDFFSRWNTDPVLMVMVAVAVLIGFSAWRKQPAGDRNTAWKGLAGTILLLLLFVSPLCAITTALFSARVAHHIILIALAAPLLSGFFHPLYRSPTPVPPGLAALLKAGILWLWHLPTFYAAAYDSPAVYWIMQTSLLGVALLFWSSVLAFGRREPLAVLLALLATVIQMGLLGAILTFVPAPLYPPHFTTTAPWNLSPLEDQQIGGALMWVPGAVPYLIAAIALPLARPYRRVFQSGKPR